MLRRTALAVLPEPQEHDALAYLDLRLDPRTRLVTRDTIIKCDGGFEELRELADNCALSAST